MLENVDATKDLWFVNLAQQSMFQGILLFKGLEENQSFSLLKKKFFKQLLHFVWLGLFLLI